MVVNYGMSDKIGTIDYGGDGEVFLGRDFGATHSYSESKAAEIDAEVHRIIDDAYQRCVQILTEKNQQLHDVAEYLLRNETMDGETFVKVFNGESVPDKIANAATAEELKTREPDMKWPFRCKVVLAGSENDDPDFTKLIESCGAEVVCDRYCYGAVESRIPIEIKEGDDPLYVIARHYLETSNCPRFMPQDEMRARKKRIAELAKEYHADGVIVASNKFCEYWSYERVIDTVVLPRDFGLPVCSIEKEYINSASGQLRTRFQAFVESVEIKKIQEGK